MNEEESERNYHPVLNVLLSIVCFSAPVLAIYCLAHVSMSAAEPLFLLLLVAGFIPVLVLTNKPSRTAKSAALSAIMGFTVVLTVTGYFLYAIWDWSRDKTYDKSVDWPQYYQSTVAHQFKLPAELTLVKAEHTDTSIMGARFIVQFQLPASKAPAYWVQKIAKDSQFPTRYRKTPYLYDCDDCDLYRIAYLPAQKIYEVQWGWD